MIDKLHIVLQYIKSKKNNRFSSREELEKWQEKQILKHLNWVKENSKFYENYYAARNIEYWREFPKINKQIMMDNFDDLNTIDITKEKAFDIALEAERSRDFSPTYKDVTIGLSSGTSGNRGVFLVSEKERLLWAGTVLSKVLPNSLFSSKKHRIAFFLRANSNLYNTVNKGKIQFKFFDLLDPLDKHISELKEYQPTILVAPASMLRMLADSKLKNNLGITPEKVVNVAEVLDPLDEKRISNAFNQKVHQVYQCTEGFLATTCEHGTLHLNEDVVCIQKEYIDEERGKFIPIITDFSRRSQPIIRYELNDILTEKQEPCECGSVFTAIEQIEGRCDDLFYFPSIEGKEPIPIFPDFIRRSVISSSVEIQDYKVEQLDVNTVKIYFTSPNDVREDIQDEIRKSLNCLCNNLKCKPPEIIYDEKFEQIKGVKLRRVERKFKI